MPLTPRSCNSIYPIPRCQSLFECITLYAVTLDAAKAPPCVSHSRLLSRDAHSAPKDELLRHTGKTDALVDLAAEEAAVTQNCPCT